MKILLNDKNKGIMKLRIENPDDLWVLSNIINKNDIVKSFTERKIKLNSNNEKTRIIKKKVYLSLKVDKVILEDNRIRILGFTNEEKEDIPKGSAHSFNISINDELTIIKEWNEFEIKIIKESQKNNKGILIVLFDREEAKIFLVNNKSVEELSSLKGEVAKKRMNNDIKSNFFKELKKIIEDYYERIKPEAVIIASPAFWTEYLKKEKINIKNLIITSISSTEKNSIKEILKRPELKEVLIKSRALKETKFLEDIMKAIANNKAVYGIKEVEEKINEGNIKELFISNNLLKKMRMDNNYLKIRELLKTAEKIGAEVHLITSEENIKRYDNLGGIISINRW